MMFSQDWPYQSCGEKGARTFLEQASLSDAEKEAIAHGNWSGLLMAYGVIQMMKQEVRKAMTSIEERLKTLEDEHQIRAPTNSFADICLSGNAQQFEALWIECGQPHCD